MKRLLFFVFPGLAIVACKKSGSDVTPPSTTPVLKVDNSKLSLSNDSTVKGVITISSNISWVVSTSASWLSISPTTGNGNATLHLSSKDINNTSADRTATVTVSPAGNASVQSISITVTQSQVIPVLTWTKLFGGSASDETSCIFATTDGGFIIAGSTYSNNGDVVGFHGFRDALVIKTDANGNKTWSKAFGGINWDQLKSIVPSADGGYVLAGVTQSSDGDLGASGFHGSQDAWILKIDAGGNKVWSKLFGGSDYDGATSITTASDGGYLVAGYSSSSDGDVSGNKGNQDGWLLKLDADGNKQWSKLYGGTGEDNAYAITKTSDGGYIIAGQSSSNNGDVSGAHGGQDLWVMKTNGSGTKQWSKLFGSSANDATFSASSLLATPNGGCVVGAFASNSGGDVGNNLGGTDAWVLKLDVNGNKVWTKVFSGTAPEGANTVLSTINGGYLVLLNTQSNDGDITGNHGQLDGVLMHLDRNGGKLWSKTLGATHWDIFSQITPTTDGGFAIAGQTNSNSGALAGNHGLDDAFLMKLKVP